jgi:carbamoyl-phosphate synthase large subunit
VIRAVGVETGGSNVQFAVDPVSEEVLVIEMNPRVSRSSALASKATGFPIAKIAARLAVGYALEEIPNDITKLTPASFEPADRLRRGQVAAVRVREVPRRPSRADDAHEVGRRGDGDRAHVPAGVRQGAALARARQRERLLRARRRRAAHRARAPGSDRFDVLLEAFRKGASVEDVDARTRIDPWFLRELRALALDPSAPFRGERSFKAVDTCAAEFEARTPYFYSGWERRARTRSSAASRRRS